MGDQAELKPLRWRCRRGMKELDQLLVRYIEQRYPPADSSERAAFQRLLACEDDALWRWFLSREAPPDPELQAIVQRVLSLA